MQELYTLLANAPSFIQVLVLVLALIGGYVLYRFKTIVIMLAGAVGVYMSLKKGKK